MATKKTTPKTDTKAKAKTKAAPKATKKAAAPKAAKAPKAPKEKAEKPALPRHPKGRVAHLHESKAALAKSLAPQLVHEGEDESALADRLRTASNSQLLRLSHVVQTVQQKYGSRAKLIEAIGSAEKKASDKDYLAKLESFSLPRLLDLAVSHERRARA